MRHMWPIYGTAYTPPPLTPIPGYVPNENFAMHY